MLDLKAKPFYLGDEAVSWVQRTLVGMDDAEKLGQFFVPIGYSGVPAYLDNFIHRYHIGGIMYRCGDAAEMQKTHRYLQEHSPIPLLIGANLEEGVFPDSERLGWCFIDWSLELNKQAALMGVYLYALRAGARIAALLGRHGGGGSRHLLGALQPGKPRGVPLRRHHRQQLLPRLELRPGVFSAKIQAPVIRTGGKGVTPVRHKKDCLLREVAGDYLILPTGLSAVHFNGMIELSETAAFVYRLLDQTICLCTPEPLAVEPFFWAYLTEPRANCLRCEFAEDPGLPAEETPGRLIFDNQMHRIVLTPAGVWQNFYIPYALAPRSPVPDAVQRLDDAEIRIRYRPRAAHYFATASGCFNALKPERLLIRAGRAVLHAAFVEWQGRGIAFTAPSGTGKSTQAALWEKYAGAETVNGDRMAFGLRAGRLWGFGIPIAGSSQIIRNRALPLGAVVLLEQGPENLVFRESPARALPFLLSQTTVNRWDGAFMDGVMDLLEALLRQLPVFRLRCRPDAGAVSCLRAALEAEAP